MNKATRTISVAVFLVLTHSTLWAQQGTAVFFKVETSIKVNEPDWTLMNRWSAPQGQAMGYLWRLDQHEVFIMVIRQQSTEVAIRVFQDDGLGRNAQGKTAPLKLDIGDACYLRQLGPHIAVVLRKENLLVRLGSDSSGPDLLTRFARHIGAALEDFDGPNTTEAKSHLKKGEQALTDRRYEEAIEEFKQAISLDGPSAEAYHGLGLAYLQVGDKTNALNSFKEAVRLKPDWAQAHFDLGHTYYETGEYTSAANSLGEAVRLQPDFFDALISLGKSYQHAGLHANSVTAFQKAVLLRPDNIDARAALGSALIMAGQPQDAITVLEEVARLAPQSALIQTNLGQAYRLTGKFQQALNALTEGLRISPEDPVAHNWLGLTYESLGQQQAAISAYRRAIELKPDYAEAHYNLGLLYLVLGDRSQAEQEYNTLKSLNSDLADALLQRMTVSRP